MSIKTSKTNAHQQRAMPKPLRKGGLHSIETTGAIYAHAFTGQYAESTPQPADRQRVADARVRAALQASNNGHAKPVHNSTVDHKKHPYEGKEFAPSVRPGAMDAAALPSGGYVEQAQREAVRRAALPFVPTRKRA